MQGLTSRGGGGHMAAGREPCMAPRPAPPSTSSRGSVKAAWHVLLTAFPPGSTLSGLDSTVTFAWVMNGCMRHYEGALPRKRWASAAAGKAWRWWAGVVFRFECAHGRRVDSEEEGGAHFPTKKWVEKEHQHCTGNMGRIIPPSISVWRSPTGLSWVRRGWLLLTVDETSKPAVQGEDVR